jgi:ABC-type transport system involved in multi-copper enzyme maturation permease subunit
MSPARLARVFRQECGQYLRRPLVWILVLVVAFFAYGLSGGQVRISSGDSQVGGTKAWITSEFAAAQLLTLMSFILYPFFLAVTAGMAVIRDDELKTGELLHATPLTAGEYVWGKFLGALVTFLGVLAFNVGALMFFNHLVPSSTLTELRGPFSAVNYLRPALVLVVPAFVFVAGFSFAVGEWTRRPIVVFALPVALLLVCGFFLWEWAPTWLDPRVDEALMLVDPAGFRWLNQTWLKVDRGVDFYNHARIDFDRPFLASRLAFVLAGLLAVALGQRHFAVTLRGSRRVAAGRRFGAGRRQAAAPELSPEAAYAAAPLASLGMRSGVPGFLRSVALVARVELRELRNQPGLYLFVPLILIQTVGTSLVAVGAFDTPLLATPGTLAVRCMNTLTVLVCLLLLFYTVESLERERLTGLASIYGATPVRTAAMLFGKALANSVVGVAVLLGALAACVVVLLIQGRVGVELWPFLLTWGLLLTPTFLAWASFVTAVLALTGNRYATYGLGLVALLFTGYRQLTDRMNWVGNWDLWSAVRWSDMSLFEVDRRALVLNRLMVLGLAVFFTALAVRTFRRREPDPARVLVRLYPLALVKTGLRLLPYAAAPLVAGILLYADVYRGFEGDVAKKQQKDYWRANVATWSEVPPPALKAVDLDLELEPARRWFKVRGFYDMLNQGKKPLARFVLTGGGHWEDIHWTLGGEECRPEDRSRLFVFSPSAAVPPGGRFRVGFAYEGTFPKGVSKNGRGTGEFILPSAVVLTCFSPSFLPIPRYLEDIGVDKDNKHDSRVYPDDFYEGITDPIFGSPGSFTTSVRVTAPADFTVNSVGVLESESEHDGRRTVVWKSDHPVRLLNVVAGRWKVRRGEGTAVYYHPGHDYNLEEIGTALDAARKYYSEWFYPYPWKELKLSEFPDLSSYAQGFGTNITFSEGIGFLTESDPKAELAFIVTAHEAAHQWWGNILTPGKGPGGNILAEGMAHFSTILLAEQVKGPRSRIEFCKRIEEKYNKDRRQDSELPLVKTDGSKDGDTTVTYDKGGWVFWMLLRHLGRERALAGLRAFIEEYHDGPDFPVLQDFVACMRRSAPDPAAYDAFVKQWFFEVVVPEYRLSDPKCVPAAGDTASAGLWEVTVKVENAGSGRMPVEVAAARGERFGEDGQPSGDYQDARTGVTLGAGESREVTIRCPFRPDRVLVDPDATVLQLRRKFAVARF